MNKRIKKKKGIYTSFKDEELINLDITISKFILPRLIKFRDNTISTPSSFYFDEDNKYVNPVEYNGDKKDREAYEKKVYKHWSNILNKMIWSFNEIAYRTNEPNILKYNYNEKWFQDLKIYDDKIQEGLNLFAKYFRDLWD